MVVSELYELNFTILDVSSMLTVDVVPLGLPLVFLRGVLCVSFSHGRSMLNVFLLKALTVISVSSIEEVVSDL